MNGKDILKVLKKNGWTLQRVNGSHHILKKDDKSYSLAVHHNDIPNGTIKKIENETNCIISQKFKEKKTKENC